MKWILITEEKIPNDIELFDASFLSNANSNEYSPTIEFLKYAYSRLNDEFFKNDVSANKPVEFKLEQLIEKSGNKLGYVEINSNDDTNEIESYCIALNKSAKLTVHGWYETILHEMIHIYEEAYFPENMNKPNYEPHGEWFINQCNRFKKYGFNIGGTYDGQFGIEDDDEMKDMLSEYIYFQPGMRNGNPDLFKAYSADKDKWIAFMKNNTSIESCSVWKTNNVNSLKLPVYSFPPNTSIGINTNNLTDEFNNKYGPFEMVDTIEVGKIYFKEIEETESIPDGIYFKVEQEEGLDDYMREMWRKYGDNLIFIEKTDTGYRYGID